MIDGGLRGLFKQRFVEWHWQPIETGGVGRGVPDTNMCHDGRECWIEFKATPGWQVELRPEQVSWLSRRGRAGGRVFVAVRRQVTAGVRRLACDELFLIDGAYAIEVRAMGLREFDGKPWALYRGDGGPRRWDWDCVGSVLLGAT